MAEIPLPEDEATLYVLGRLNPAERRDFEARLEKSAELRALVADLEAGVVAAALTVPQREPPPRVWEQIERAVAKEAAPKSALRPFSFWNVWLRSGWAAAACLLGALLYLLWIDRSASPVNPPPELAENLPSTPPAPVDSGRHNFPSPPAGIDATNPATPATRASQLARIGEIAALRRQVRELENQVGLLSQSLTQQQVLAAGSSQFVLFPVTPPNSTAGVRAVSRPTPEMQRALFMAMARELGWQRGQSASAAGNPDPARSGDPGVDFVDLAPSHKEDSRAKAASGGAGDPGATNSAALAGTPADEEATASGGTLSMLGFRSPTSDNLVLVVDHSASALGMLTLWDHDQAIGNFSVDANTTVVTINSAASGGGTFTITSGGAFNLSNVVGQFTAPPSTPH